jgi:two-component system, chemotaxis family, chemotaxis protein CheY
MVCVPRLRIPSRVPAYATVAKHILIADDNASIRFLIRTLIESAGFDVCAEAVDGADAVEKAKQFLPDLILMDFSMPRLNGAEAASILKRNIPRIPIILFTMHEDSIGKALTKQIGVDRVIGKPDGMSKLVDSMNDLLGLTPKTQSSH